MKNINILIISALLVLSITNNVCAQNQTQVVEMADKFRAEGKIYVVVAVMLIVLIGLWAFVWNIDQKISKIENELSDIANKKI